MPKEDSDHMATDSEELACFGIRIVDNELTSYRIPKFMLAKVDMDQKL